MDKISLPPIAGGFNLSQINTNFQRIADILNHDVLYRDSENDRPNGLRTDLDANNKRIYNLPAPVHSHEAVNLITLEKYTKDLPNFEKEMKRLAQFTLEQSELAQESAETAEQVLEQVNEAIEVAKINNRVTNYTLNSGDRGQTVVVDSPDQVMITVPAGESTFPLGSVVFIMQIGTGVVEVKGAVGVYINGLESGGGVVSTQWQGVVLTKVKPDFWVLSGALL